MHILWWFKTKLQRHNAEYKENVFQKHFNSGMICTKHIKMYLLYCIQESLKRKSSPSCKFNNSTPMQARTSIETPKSSPDKPAAVMPVATLDENTIPQEVSITRRNMEVDESTDADSFLQSLDMRGKAVHSEHLLTASMFYNWSAQHPRHPWREQRLSQKWKGWGSQTSSWLAWHRLAWWRFCAWLPRCFTDGLKA